MSGQKYIQDPITHELLPAREYYHRQALRERVARSKTLHMPAFKVFQSYRSPLTGQWIDSASQERDHMARNSVRHYEGYADEQKEADNYRAEQDKKAAQSIAEGVRETYHKLKNNMVEPADPNKTLNVLDD